MVIDQWIVINKNTQLVGKTGRALTLPQHEALSPEGLYNALQCNYLKFFKMDKLCKWAWVGAEYLFRKDNGLHYSGADKNNVAVCLATAHGCMDVDKRYLDGIVVPSPALFVYTLPNIMLGEICIRHGFKGEQLCTLSEKFDTEEMFFNVKGLLDRGMEACICGWVDVYDEQYDVCLFWITKKGIGLNCTAGAMHDIYMGKTIA